MPEHSETMELLAKAKSGDENAKEILIKENTPLMKSIIRRFTNKGIDYDDLFSLASLGLVKAINNFDTSFNVRFSTYVVPMVMGEIKRFLRDDGYIKVSRAIKVLSFKIARYSEEYKLTHKEEPKISDIAEKFGVSEEDVVCALDASKTPVSVYESSDGDDTPLLDRLKCSDKTEKIDELIILKGGIAKLDEREKKILLLRYYRDMTQSQIASYFGLSQVQISRLESKIYEKLKKEF